MKRTRFNRWAAAVVLTLGVAAFGCGQGEPGSSSEGAASAVTPDAPIANPTVTAQPTPGPTATVEAVPTQTPTPTATPIPTPTVVPDAFEPAAEYLEWNFRTRLVASTDPWPATTTRSPTDSDYCSNWRKRPGAPTLPPPPLDLADGFTLEGFCVNWRLHMVYRHDDAAYNERRAWPTIDDAQSHVAAVVAEFGRPIDPLLFWDDDLRRPDFANAATTVNVAQSGPGGLYCSYRSAQRATGRFERDTLRLVAALTSAPQLNEFVDADATAAVNTNFEFEVLDGGGNTIGRQTGSGYQFGLEPALWGWDASVLTFPGPCSSPLTPQRSEPGPDDAPASPDDQSPDSGDCTDVAGQYVTVVSPPAPPFFGTLFISSAILTNRDPSSFEGLSYAGQGLRVMFDRRTDSFEEYNAHLFNADYGESTTVEIQVNPEFALAEAERLAVLYGQALGHMPAFVFPDLETMWIHAGNELAGGGNNNILIHTGQGAQYIADGILEEMMVHEGAHTSLDSLVAVDPAWLAAQEADGTFLSTYARDFPAREDLAETIAPWMAVRFFRDRIGESLAATIEATIPNRLRYLDCSGLSPAVLE